MHSMRATGPVQRSGGEGQRSVTKTYLSWKRGLAVATLTYPGGLAMCPRQPSDTIEARARRLVAELHGQPPNLLQRWLTKLE